MNLFGSEYNTTFYRGSVKLDIDFLMRLNGRIVEQGFI